MDARLNELAAHFEDINIRKQMIEEFGESKTNFYGKNADKEVVCIAIDSEKGIILHTYQANGWIRVNYYDKNGKNEGETFDGHWNK